MPENESANGELPINKAMPGLTRLLLLLEETLNFLHSVKPLLKYKLCDTVGYIRCDADGSVKLYRQEERDVGDRIFDDAECLANRVWPRELIV